MSSGIIFIIIWVLVAVVLPLVSNKKKEAGKGAASGGGRRPIVQSRPLFAEIFPEIKLEPDSKAKNETEAKVVEKKTVAVNRPNPVNPVLVSAQENIKEESFEEKMSKFDEKEKMIIYSEILKPKFDE